MHRVRAFRAVGAEPRPQRLTHGKDEITDPRHRQIGEDLVRLPQPIEFGRRFRRFDHVAVRQNHALGFARGPGGIEHHAGAVVIQHRDAVVQRAQQFVPLCPARVLHMGILVQFRMIVFPQTPRIEIDHLLECRQPVLHFDDLVDLFLIPGDHEPRAAMIKDISHLFSHRVLIKRDGDGPTHVSGDHRPIKVGAVAPDDCHVIARRKAQVQQTQRQRFDLIQRLAPRPALPDPEFLFAIGGRIRIDLRVPAQQRRKRVRVLRALGRSTQRLILPYDLRRGVVVFEHLFDSCVLQE